MEAQYDFQSRGLIPRRQREATSGNITLNVNGYFT
jgi:hypothetical protein